MHLHNPRNGVSANALRRIRNTLAEQRRQAIIGTLLASFIHFSAAYAEQTTLENKMRSQTSGATVWSPAPGTSWQIQLQGVLDTSYKVAMYDIDLFDTKQVMINDLQSRGIAVVCYFSAGSWEDWRSDADQFPENLKGRSNGWPGEKWLDIRDINALAPIMRARLDLAAEKGCDGVDPDNVDGFTNVTGFPLTGKQQLSYNIWLANEAHARGLSIGLKNDLQQIAELVPYYDFAVNEQCNEYQECELLTPFVEAGKAVFGIEYHLPTASFCSATNTLNFDFLKKTMALRAERESCR